MAIETYSLLPRARKLSAPDRLVGVRNVLEALPHLLLDYPSSDAKACLPADQSKSRGVKRKSVSS